MNAMNGVSVPLNIERVVLETILADGGPANVSGDLVTEENVNVGDEVNTILLLNEVECNDALDHLIAQQPPATAVRALCRSDLSMVHPNIDGQEKLGGFHQWDFQDADGAFLERRIGISYKLAHHGQDGVLHTQIVAKVTGANVQTD